MKNNITHLKKIHHENWVKCWTQIKILNMISNWIYILKTQSLISCVNLPQVLFRCRVWNNPRNKNIKWDLLIYDQIHMYTYVGLK